MKSLIIEKNKILAPLTTFKIGGPADYFCEARTEQEVRAAMGWAKKQKQKYVILGMGSNILVSDKGYRGLIIKMCNNAINLLNSNELKVDAGVKLSRLLEFTIKNNLSGLEFLVGIPGTVGGAIAGNVGAWDKAICNFVKKVFVINAKNRNYIFKNKDCRFKYRESRFKSSREVILSAIIRLNKQNKTLINKRIKKYIQKRQNQPKGKSAGCIFKNPACCQAGKLIDSLGLKGWQIGDALISKQHANFIINTKNASCSDVFKLISIIKQKVKEKCKITLKEEIRIIGELHD